MSNPAPLTKPACTKADTGVGAANVLTSQRWNGTSADLDAPAITNKMAANS